MSENRCRKKDGTYRTADFLSDAELQSHPPQNPHSRCRFYLATGMATRAARQKYKCSYHVELGGLRMPAITEHNTGPKNRNRDLGHKLPHHVLAKFFGARVRIVIRSIPLNRSILSYHFILTLARDRNRAYQTKSSQPVVIMRLLRQQEHLQRAAQVYIQAAFLRFAIQRRRAMQHRIGGMNQPVIDIARQSQLRRS